VDATRLTISTNDVHAPTPRGELNFTSGDILWSANLPSLQYLTNFGRISAASSIYLGTSGQTPPWISGTFDSPYQSIVTHGPISSTGCLIWANYFEASSTNDTGIGPLGVQANSAIITNGAFLTTDADITLACGSLLISNQVLEAGRSISLAVTNYLDDGSLSNSVDGIASPNTWTTGNGLDLLLLPPQASLLATTVTNNAFPNAEVDISWAGADRGPVAAGFGNNAALGRLILDGGLNSSFLISGTTATNALYVDYLEMRDFMTNFDDSGNLANLQFAPGMKIYYAQLIINGVSWAEKLNGKNGGGLNWVSAYAGTYSYTNVVYPDGTTNRLNLALVQSCDIDSNGNGIPNCMDPAPVFVPSEVALAATFTNLPQRSVVLAWNSIPHATNSLFFKPSTTATNWQLLTNYVLGPVGGRQRVVDPMGVGGRIYRVQVNAAVP
jgi:hypothetical protein